MLDAERNRLVAGHRADPGERGRVAVDDGDNRRMPGQGGISVSIWLVAERVAPGAGALGRGPAGVQPVGGGDGQHTDIAPVVSAMRPAASIASGATTALVGDDHLAIRAGLAQPVGAVDRALAESLVGPRLAGCSIGLVRPQIDRAAGLVAQPGAFVRIALAIRCR
jgi:hypothetical protein